MKVDIDYVPHREVSRLITKDERDIAVERLDVYKEWFLKTVMRTGKYDSVVIIPIEEISPRYRDEPPPFVIPYFFGTFLC